MRGYALAIGWRPLEGGDRGGFDAQGVPELSYLVSDPSQPRPTWVPEAAIAKHFRTFLSGVPEPASGADEPS